MASAASMASLRLLHLLLGPVKPACRSLQTKPLLQVVPTTTTAVGAHCALHRRCSTAGTVLASGNVCHPAALSPETWQVESLTKHTVDLLQP